MTNELREWRGVAPGGWLMRIMLRVDGVDIISDIDTPVYFAPCSQFRMLTGENAEKVGVLFCVDPSEHHGEDELASGLHQAIALQRWSARDEN